MNNHSSLKIRQLTEYRSWPDGRQGCLFYIPFLTNIDDLIFGGIYLMDAPWRKEDKVGDYDNLHQCEWEMLNDDNCLIGGFGALIYAQQWNLFEHRNTIAAKWKQYCEEINRKTGRDYSDMDHLKAECICWEERKPDLLEAFMPDAEKEGPDGLFDFLISHRMEHIQNDIYTLMWEFRTIIHSADNSTAFQAKYGIPVVAMLNRNGTHGEQVAAGFKASFINYLASLHAVQTVMMLDSLEKKVKLFLSFFENGQLMTMDQIVFDIYGTNCKELFDTYIKATKRFAVNRVISDPELLNRQPTNKNEWRYFKEMLLIETDLYRHTGINDYLTQNQVQALGKYTQEFLHYLEQIYRGFPEALEEEENPIPEKGDYIALALWISKQKNKGCNYYADAGNNRSEMCRKLAKTLGWTPDPGALGKAQKKLSW